MAEPTAFEWISQVLVPIVLGIATISLSGLGYRLARTSHLQARAASEREEREAARRSDWDRREAERRAGLDAQAAASRAEETIRREALEVVETILAWSQVRFSDARAAMTDWGPGLEFPPHRELFLRVEARLLSTRVPRADTALSVLSAVNRMPSHVYSDSGRRFMVGAQRDLVSIVCRALAGHGVTLLDMYAKDTSAMVEQLESQARALA